MAHPFCQIQQHPCVFAAMQLQICYLVWSKLSHRGITCSSSKGIGSMQAALFTCSLQCKAHCMYSFHSSSCMPMCHKP